jgi:hypothetical protein
MTPLGRPDVPWARLPADTSAGDELRLARRTATAEALAHLPRIARDLAVDVDVLDELRAAYEARLADWRDEDDSSDPADTQRRRQYVDLSLALLAQKRQTVVRLRDERVIDDTVLRQVQAHLDIEEIRLADQHEVD